MHDMIRAAIIDGRPLVVFVITDCDPSGWQMFISIARKLQAMRDHSYPSLRFEIVHVGLTPEQVRDLELPEEPIKAGDKRAENWEKAFRVKQTEIDALTTPEMVEQGVLRQMLDDAIKPYLDPTLERRVEQAKDEWEREAAAAVEEQIDHRALARVRQRVERLSQQIERAKEQLHALTDDIELPELEVPEPDLDAESLDSTRHAEVKFDDDWVTVTKFLKARKAYEDENGED